MSEELRVTVGDGKYTYIMKDGKVEALRCGEPWPAGTQSLIGDKMAFCMACEISVLRNLLRRVEVHLDMSDKYDTALWRDIVEVLERNKD